MKKYIFCLLIIIALCYSLYFINNEVEHFNNNIMYFTREQGVQFLINNEDKYYQTFNDIDLQVRNIQKISDYTNNIKNSVVDFSPNIMNELNTMIMEIKDKMKDINYDYFNGNKANTIEWKLICIKGQEYEYGLPHTRNDVIILPLEYINSASNDSIKKTLFHELIHIYQRKYPNDIQKYLDKHKYKKFKIKNEVGNTRANPDLDEWIYKDDDGKIYCSIYNDNPSSILDVVYHPINNSNSEHPYEQMAYELSQEV